MAAIIDTLDLLSRSAEPVTGRVTDLAEFITREPTQLAPHLVKLPEEEEDAGFVSTLFGIPLGFQFATGLGMRGLPAFALDILTDPTTYLTGGIGGLTKLGRAGKVSKSLSNRKITNAIDSLAGTRGVTKETALNVMSQGLKNAARMDTDAYRHLDEIISTAGSKNEAIKRLRAIKKGGGTLELGGGTVRTRTHASVPSREFKDPKTKRFRSSKFPQDAIPAERDLDLAMNAIRAGGIDAGREFAATEITRRTLLQQKAVELAKAGNKREFNKIAKQILKLKPSRRAEILLSRENRRNMGAMFDLSKQGQRAKPLLDSPAAQAAHRVDGMSAPQRSLLKFTVPFTDFEKTLVVGQPVINKVSKATERLTFLKKTAPAGLVPGARAAARATEIALNQPKRVAAPDTVHDAMAGAATSIRSDAIPEELGHTKGIQEVWTAERNLGQTKSWIASNEFVEAMPNVKDREKVLQLVDQPGKYLKNRPGKSESVKLASGVEQLGSRQALAKGTYGDTAIMGELTDEAKKFGMTDEHVLMAEAVDSALRVTGDELVKEGLIESTIFNYFPRIVKKINDQEKWAAQLARLGSAKSVSKFYSHGLDRKIPHFEQLLAMEKEGIIEVEKDAAKILGEYFKSSTQVAANARLLRRVGDAKEPLEVVSKGSKREITAPIIITGKTKGGKPSKLLDTGEYVAVNDPHVVSFVGQMGGKWTKPGQTVWIRKESAPIIRRIAEPATNMRAQPGESVTEKAFRGALTLNSFMKRSLLFGSAFHYMALTESAVADLGWNFLKNPFQAFRQGQREFFEASDILDVAIKSGLQAGPMMDAEVDTLQKALQWAERSIPSLGPAFRQFGRATGAWDRGLWDYYHNGLKMFAFHELYQRGLSKFPGKGHKEIAKGVAEHVNNAFGGQVWENMLVSKNGQRWARMFFLAPDWTLSNLRIASDVFANRFKKQEWFQKTGRAAGFVVGENEILRADVRAMFSRQYALRTGLIFAGMANMANFALNGHFMDKNSEGFKSSIKLPWTDDGGREKYLRFGKQFREPFELMDVWDDKGGPVAFFNRKASPILRQGITQVTGRDVFGQPIVTHDAGPLRQTADRLGFAIKSGLPISAQTAAFRESANLGEALAGAAGLPIKTKFQRGKLEDEAVGVSEFEIPQAFGALAEDKTYNRQVLQAQREMLNAANTGLWNVPSEDLAVFQR